MPSDARDFTKVPPLAADRKALLEEYLSDAALRLGDATLIDYESSIRVFLSWLDQADSLTVGDHELRGFLLHLTKQREVSERTILRYYSAIQSLYQYLEYEERILKSPVPKFRKRYLAAITREAKKERVGLRPLLNVEQAADLVHSILDPRDRALTVLLFKTGIRREEAARIDLEDIDWDELSIDIKPRRKRTNLVVFFDDEAARVLKQWLSVRQARGAPARGPLFTNQLGTRLQGRRIYEVVRGYAEARGLYDAAGPAKKKFTPHATRHFFTTHLLEAGMPREWVAWLRGDAPAATIDIYNHVNRRSVRDAYREKIPRFDL